MICVDKLRRCVPNDKWKWKESCHLWDDGGDLQALHGFASLLGLRRRWFHDRPGFPHYDLTRRMRELAVGKGAKEQMPRTFCGRR